MAELLPDAYLTPTPNEEITLHDGRDVVRIEYWHPYGTSTIELPVQQARQLHGWLGRWLAAGHTDHHDKETP